MEIRGLAFLAEELEGRPLLRRLSLTWCLLPPPAVVRLIPCGLESLKLDFSKRYDYSGDFLLAFLAQSSVSLKKSILHGNWSSAKGVKAIKQAEQFKQVFKQSKQAKQASKQSQQI